MTQRPPKTLRGRVVKPPRDASAERGGEAVICRRRGLRVQIQAAGLGRGQLNQKSFQYFGRGQINEKSFQYFIN